MACAMPGSVCQPVNGNAGAEAENAARLAAIETRIAEIDKELAAEVSGLRGPSEPRAAFCAGSAGPASARRGARLILATPEWKPTPEETFIWVVTKTDVRWVRSDLGTAALTREVAALRCGLDATKWDDAAQNCEAHTKANRRAPSAAM